MSEFLPRAPSDPPPTCGQRKECREATLSMEKMGAGVLPDVGHVEWWECRDCRALHRFVLVASDEPQLPIGEGS